MTYEETIQHIFALGRFGIKPGLERISAILAGLGNPQKSLRVIHVAGTNGKGSTASFLASVLRAGGYRTGLFTSPHLTSFTERFRINGVEISEEQVVSLTARVRAAAPPEATFFEIVTAIAFLWFADESVDLAVMEVGMGGRFDATNVADGILSLITPVALDHCEYLGNTLAEIAGEKSGVMRPGCPVVLASQPDEALARLETRAVEIGSPCYRFGRDFQAVWEDGGLAYVGLGIGLSGLRPGIGGRYQAVNAACALAAAELISAGGVPLAQGALHQGVTDAFWPGRMELFPGPPRLLLDGAHNPAGSLALAEELRFISRDKLILVVGVMGDKDLDGILEPLLACADQVVAVSPGLDRALPSERLVDYFREKGVRAVDAGEVAAGVRMAFEQAGRNDLIVVCGSLFTVAEARAARLGRSCELIRG